MIVGEDRMKFLILATLCLASVIGLGCELFSRPHQGKKINEVWETSNDRFKISVTAYAEEKGGFVGGAYYIFRSATVGSDNWQEIMMFGHDDPVPIPRQQVHFVNDKIGYIFMGWMYAVTTDAGLNWSVWRAEKDLPGWQCCNYSLIRNVQVAPNGAGTMKLNPIPLREGEVAELRTHDYGRHWASE
jgi:hypothetical protein